MYILDRQTGIRERVDVTSVAEPKALRTVDSFGNERPPCESVVSGSPVVSDDGRYVAFVSNAANLVPNDFNARNDVFLRDRVAGTVEKISLTTLSTEADGHSGWGAGGMTGKLAMSPDARYIAFKSAATNLIPNDINGKVDIYVRDRATPDTFRISLSNSQTEANNDVLFPSMSEDGRYFAFQFAASNLVAGDTNGTSDVFVRDELLDTTTRVSVSSLGVQGNGSSTRPVLNTSGTHVAFMSAASNLVPYDFNGTSVTDIFVRSLTENRTFLASRTTFGAHANNKSEMPSIDATGRFIAFQSDASNLSVEPLDSNSRTDVFIRDMASMPERMSEASDGTQVTLAANRPSVSVDGRWVASHTIAALDPADTNGVADVYLKDRYTGAIELVSLTEAGDIGNGPSRFAAVSQDARYVAYVSLATNMLISPADTNGKADVFVRDRLTGQTELVSTNDAGELAVGGDSRFPAISDDGRYIAFQSEASNLVAGDTNGKWDVFLRDRLLQTTTRISVNSTGTQADKVSARPFISALGGFVTFHSWATNLVPGDTNNKVDVFVRDVNNGITERVSVDSNEVQANGDSQFPSISSNGKWVAFHSVATNLVSGDTNGTRDVFVRDRVMGKTYRVSVSTSGSQATLTSGFATVAQNDAKGAYIAFHSEATDLVSPGVDTNGVRDCYARWIPLSGSGLATNGVTWRVATRKPGFEFNNSLQLDNFSGTCKPARDGSPVVFQSEATNLVPGDSNGVQDIFAV